MVTDEFDSEVRDTLSKLGFKELYQLTTYRGYREREADRIQEITVEIRDGGPGDASRYRVEVTGDDGKKASGNAADSIRSALAIIHWEELDR